VAKGADTAAIRPGRKGRRAPVLALSTLLLAGAAALPPVAMGQTLPALADLRLSDTASPGEALLAPGVWRGREGPLGLFVIGLVVFAATTALIHVRSRRLWRERYEVQRRELSELQARVERADLLLASDRQVLIAWNGSDAEPIIEGDPALLVEHASTRRLLAFSHWLKPADAQVLESRCQRLRHHGEAFALSLVSLRGDCLDIEGRPAAGRAVMRVRLVTGEARERQRLEGELARHSAEHASLRQLLDGLPHPFWLRHKDRSLLWVNAAFAAAVEATDGADAVARKVDLLDSHAREAARRALADAGRYDAQVQAIVAGRRAQLLVTEVGGSGLTGGMAVDETAAVEQRRQLEGIIAAHERIIGGLATAIAIFDRTRQLRYHNEAYAKLWGLDAAFLARSPTDGEVLDRLRSERRLPQEVDYRGWKQAIIAGDQTTDTTFHQWHLPDGRTLDVRTTLSNDGSVTYLFDDVTEQYLLASRQKVMKRVQDETLDALTEGVAVFGSSGRLRLCNPAFAEIWSLPPAAITDEPHVDALIAASPHRDDPIWPTLRIAVTALSESRKASVHRAERKDGSVVDCGVIPLPDGAVLLTFSDVTAAIDAERMLQERNEALEFANRVKNDFVHNVSYQLRSPLQNVTGFVELLAGGTAGSLSERQQDYAESILKSSRTLLSLMNDIFDLASLDAGTLELSPTDVDPEEVVKAAIGIMTDRMAERNVGVDTRILTHTPFRADRRRVKQVLVHLLSNAIAFSPDGDRVAVTCREDGGEMVFEVSDNGPGIPAEVLDKVFQRFETHAVDDRQRGAGLGLSIVQAFVQRHGGRVEVLSTPGQGTRVLCRFPIHGAEVRAAAE
jgi:signal transduction histidine kinase